jgi:hypothetical protein
LESELQQNPDIEIRNFRSVKDGFTSISRPAIIGFSNQVLLKHRPYVGSLRRELGRLNERFLHLSDIFSFAENYYSEVTQDLKSFESCLEILDYLSKNRTSIEGLLPRQVPHGQSTKLIGKNPLLLKLFGFYLQKQVYWADFFSYFRLLDKTPEFRYYAPRVNIQSKKVENFHGILSESWVDSCDFSDLSGTLIVENFETFFSLSSYSKNTLILWGAGWRAARLKNLKRKWPEPLFYWGDIDKEGYEIFAYLKKSWPDLQALYMNEATIKKYHHLIQKKESSLSTINPGLKLFELQSAYDFVVQKGIQIEQEQLDEAWPFHPALT